MNDQTEKEVFTEASSAKAQLNSLEESVGRNAFTREIRRSLELIERRTDPAADPDYEPEQ